MVMIQATKETSKRGFVSTTRQLGEGIGIFGFAILAILDRFFGFWGKKLRFFGFSIHCSLRIFRFLVFCYRFSRKILTVFSIFWVLSFSSI